MFYLNFRLTSANSRFRCNTCSKVSPGLASLAIVLPVKRAIIDHFSAFLSSDKCFLLGFVAASTLFLASVAFGFFTCFKRSSAC